MQAFNGLVDIGAVSSFIHPCIADWCTTASEWTIQPSQVVATLADNTKTRIKSSVTGPCTVDGRRTTCTFLAVEQMAYEIILGMDILE